MKGYKFVSAKYADAVSLGSVRISPAHSFRLADGFDNGRADPLELIVRAQPRDRRLILRSDHPVFPENSFIFIENGKRVHGEIEIYGGQVDFIHNALLYCFSTQVDVSICAQMESTFQADALFEITDIEAFGQIISDNPLLAGRKFRGGPVKYNELIPAQTNEELPEFDYFIKQKAFSWQQEYRFVWEGEPLGEAVNLEVPEAAKLLKRLK